MAIFPTGNFFPGMGGGGFRIPGVAMRASVSLFFDRAAVKNALSDMEYKALTKASMRIKDYAKRSIQKQGMAKPMLKVMRDNPGMSLKDVARIAGLRPHTKKAIAERVFEIKTRPPSPPGTPPHTHVPYGHMLGFRRNLWNFYDPMSHSAVVGPSRKGKMLPYLHEFGGTQMLNTWVHVPKWPGPAKAILWKASVGQKPKNANRWAGPVGSPQAVRYPARPYMYPAMLKAIRSGDLARAFGGKFTASQAGRGVMVTGRSRI